MMCVANSSIKMQTAAGTTEPRANKKTFLRSLLLKLLGKRF